MFLQNTAHLQQDLFGIESHLSNKKRQKLLKSPEAAFYDLIFCNIREEDFAPLYSDKTGRPNAAINVLVASLILQQKKGWTTRELFDRIDFDLRARLALGLHSLEETPFCSASYFNFRNRLLEYFCTTGINLIERVFDSLTSEQLTKLKIKTDIQRMDSFQAISNIREYGRTQLLIEMLIRLNRILSEQDRSRFSEQLAPYVSQSSSKYLYELERSQIPHELEKLAQLYHHLYTQLKSSYSQIEVFKVFERVYTEHFCVVEDKVRVREGGEIKSGSLQSPDDLDATFRNKRGSNYRGQVVNVAETANPDNALNLITDVAVAPNNADDSTILNERIDGMKEKCPELNELHTDGAYGSSKNDQKMHKHGINHVQTALRGRVAAVAMEIEKTPDGHTVRCPMQQTTSQPTRTRHKACFDATICSSCPHSDKCPAVEQKNCRVFYFSEEMATMQQRQRALEQLPEQRQRLRPNVEATVKEFTRGYNHKGKLRVRGRFATMLFAYSMAIAINFGRIYRHLMDNPSPHRLFARTKRALAAYRGLLVRLYRYFRLLMPKISMSDQTNLLLSISGKMAF